MTAAGIAPTERSFALTRAVRADVPGRLRRRIPRCGWRPADSDRTRADLPSYCPRRTSAPSTLSAAEPMHSSSSRRTMLVCLLWRVPAVEETQHSRHVGEGFQRRVIQRDAHHAPEPRDGVHGSPRARGAAEKPPAGRCDSGGHDTALDLRRRDEGAFGHARDPLVRRDFGDERGEELGRACVWAGLRPGTERTAGGRRRRHVPRSTERPARIVPSVRSIHRTRRRFRASYDRYKGLHASRHRRLGAPGRRR